MNENQAALTPRRIASCLRRDFNLGKPTSFDSLYEDFAPSITKTPTRSVSVLDDEGVAHTFENATATAFDEAQVIARAFLRIFKPQLDDMERFWIEEFALELLMPEPEFRMSCYTSTVDGMLFAPQVAAEFAVSETLVAQNAHRLGVA